MDEYKGLEYLRRKLADKRRRVLTRYDYYEMKNHFEAFSKLTPPDMRWMKSTIGWCAKAVDTLADRLQFREFSNDSFGINEIYNVNNPDVLIPSAILGALIGSCDFIYIIDDEYPRLQVIDGANATGVIDETTGLLKEGYAVLERSRGNSMRGEPILEVYLTPGKVEVYRNGQLEEELTNVAPYPLLVPIIYRPDAVRAFGHSVITRTCMKHTQSALRTILRSEVSAEFYSFPQRYVLGMSPDAEPLDKWRATMSTLLQIDKDEDGDHPVVGQFTQQSMSPYNEQLKMFASLFAGETGLTLDDLGFVSDNPTSAEAIAASHENLRLKARSAQRTFGSGLLNAGYLSCCIRDEYAYNRRAFYQAKARWYPIFEPDYSALSSIGDGLQKLITAAPGYFGRDNLKDILGIEESENPFEVL